MTDRIVLDAAKVGDLRSREMYVHQNSPSESSRQVAGEWLRAIDYILQKCQVPEGVPS